MFRLWLVTISAAVLALAWFSRDVLLTLSMVGAGLLATFLYPRFQRAHERRLTRRMLQKADLTGIVGEHTLEITPDGLVERNAKTKNRASWDSLHRVERTPEFLAIYLNPSTAHVVPLKGLPKEDVLAFENEVRRRMANATAASSQ